jgi:hypothetical protein
MSRTWLGMMEVPEGSIPKSRVGMKFPRVPDQFVGGLAALPELLRAAAKWRGMSHAEVEEVVRLVPPPIIESICFLDKLTSLWRYDCGEPFDRLPGNQVVFGTNMYNEVDRLFDVINLARSRLDGVQLRNYLSRLADPNKHQDFLFEFAPILRLDSSIRADYEVPGYAARNGRVDWLIRSKPVPLLLDVKNRTRDLIESLVRFQLGERDPDGTAPAPTHDPSLLFRSVEQKFKPRSPSEVIQGVWIVSAIAQEESELHAAFAKLDPSRVHLAIVGDWEDDVYVLTNDANAKKSVMEILRLRESRRAVFCRGVVRRPNRVAVKVPRLRKKRHKSI